MARRFRAQLMTAYHRCGRAADALAVYRQARQVLAGELGIEPGPDLRELQQRILRGDRDAAAAGRPPHRTTAADSSPAGAPRAATQCSL